MLSSVNGMTHLYSLFFGFVVQEWNLGNLVLATIKKTRLHTKSTILLFPPGAFIILPGDLEFLSGVLACLFGFGDLPSPTLRGFFECLSANFSAFVFFFCFSGLGECSLLSLSLEAFCGFGVSGKLGEAAGGGSTMIGIGCSVGLSGLRGFEGW